MVGLGLLGASPAEGAGFKYGVAAGEVTDSSAMLWTRADRPGPVVLELSRDRRFPNVLQTHRLRARATRDNTVSKRVRRLAPGKRYHYRFRRGRVRSAAGTFITAPRPRSNARVEFAWTGDTDFQAAPGQSSPYWNTGDVFRRMQAERNHFNVHLGDTIYSDTEVPAPAGGAAAPTALTVAQKWAKYRQNLGNRFLRVLRGSAGFYSHWDDHEFVNDFSPRENTFRPSFADADITVDGGALYRRGARAFRDYAPVRWTPRGGLYRSFRWGRNVELFFLDERSFRDAKADDGGACDNPQTGEPDFAPTAPQRIRSVFGAVFPGSGLSQPVSQACLDAIRDPSRDFLGGAQYRRFTRGIRRSRARWKVILNEMPIQQKYINPYDGWEGYEAERQRLLRFLRDSVKNVIFLSTDVHATFVNDARLQTLEDGGPSNSGIIDFTVGSAATANYGLELDTTLNSPGAGALARDGFLEQQPPNGPGMRCAVIDQFSYGQVSVTRSRLTVTAKGPDGRRLPDCSPLTLRHRR